MTKFQEFVKKMVEERSENTTAIVFKRDGSVVIVKNEWVKEKGLLPDELEEAYQNSTEKEPCPLHNTNGPAVAYHLSSSHFAKHYWINGEYYPDLTEWERRTKEIKFSNKLEKLIE